MSIIGSGQITDVKEMIKSLSKSERKKKLLPVYNHYSYCGVTLTWQVGWNRKELAAAIPQGNTNMLNVITQVLHVDLLSDCILTRGGGDLYAPAKLKASIRMRAVHWNRLLL